MQIDKQNMLEFAEIVSQAVVNALKDNGVIGNTNTPVKEKTEKAPKTAYQKTEQLLFNYNGFLRIVVEKKQEIVELRKYGVPQKSAMSGGERVKTSHSNIGIVLPEDAVEDAVRAVERSIKPVQDAITLIENSLDKLKNDPYYDVLPMRYFEGRTLEDIGVSFGCDHTTISRNKNRLVKELSLWMFPSEVINEYMS